ncbi:hypothetical protein PIB30_008660 [Stylosanthes scabra]|uniref:Secreted protein n=1 Tax=Stylosanthes scabra TaxID=79078 RepID=A0ABU6S4U9_9FABA|nr:hypothetical protein [Stylosanthes scabra]
MVLVFRIAHQIILACGFLRLHVVACGGFTETQSASNAHMNECTQTKIILLVVVSQKLKVADLVFLNGDVHRRVFSTVRRRIPTMISKEKRMNGDDDLQGEEENVVNDACRRCDGGLGGFDKGVVVMVLLKG